MKTSPDDAGVGVSKNGPVTTVVLRRPHVRNAVDRATAEALADAFRDFEADDDARVAVLWGEGGHFSAGADLKNGPDNRVEADGDGPMGPTRMELSKPVVAAISGYAVAGGLEMALWCDLRVVEQSAVLGVFCRRLGVPLVDGGTFRLPDLVGLSRALDLILTGRPVDAREALGIGLAHRVVPDGRSRQEAEALARELASLPQTCLRNDRRAAYASRGLSVQDALQLELRLGLDTLASGEYRTGAGRFRSGEGRHGRPVSTDPSDATPGDDEPWP